ncbi:MAG TPA: class I SAM-dependent methyltransferase [Opitutaceae bacterium]|nr:class I SAM-dependent methyltransferase [Opitutaceae bacterium]
MPVARGERRCPVCGGSAIAETRYRDIAGFDIVRCARCQVLHLSPLPSEQDLARIYTKEYFCDAAERHGYLDYSRDRQFIAATYRRRFRRIARHLPRRDRPVRFHEIGCALGFGLEVAAREFGWTVSGSDVSQHGVEHARALGHPAVRSDPCGRCILPHEQPDLVCLFDVIEHLPSVHVFRDWLAAAMAPGACLALTTMDMDSAWNRLLGQRSPSIKVPQHLSYFTRATLTANLAPSFQLVNASPDFQTVSGDLLVSRLLHVAGLPSPRFSLLRRLPVVIPNGMNLYVFRRA